MTQIFGYPVIEKEYSELKDIIAFSLLKDCVVYKLHDKSYSGNYEIYIIYEDAFGDKMRVVNKITNKYLNFYKIDIDWAIKLRGILDKEEAA